MVELEEEDEEFQGRRYPEAQMPLPPTPPPESSELLSVNPPTSNSEDQSAVVDNADKDDISPSVTIDLSQADTETEADPTSVTVSPANNTDGDAGGTDVEALRQQLKKFKERFTGSGKTDIG